MSIAMQGLRQHFDWIPTPKDRDPWLILATNVIRQTLKPLIPALIQLLEGKTLKTMDAAQLIASGMLTNFVMELVPYAIPRKMMISKSFDVERKFVRSRIERDFDLTAIKGPVREFWRQLNPDGTN